MIFVSEDWPSTLLRRLSDGLIQKGRRLVINRRGKREMPHRYPQVSKRHLYCLSFAREWLLKCWFLALVTVWLRPSFGNSRRLVLRLGSFIYWYAASIPAVVFFFKSRKWWSLQKQWKWRKNFGKSLFRWLRSVGSFRNFLVCLDLLGCFVRDKEAFVRKSTFWALYGVGGRKELPPFPDLFFFFFLIEVESTH